MVTDRFGFLPCDWRFDFDGGSISPIPEIYKVRKQVERYRNEDGFMYPPATYRVELEFRTDKILRKIPKTRRPAHLHPVPPSHKLCLDHPSTVEELRNGPGALIIHLLAYLFGIRLQFHDWWFDSRVPIELGQSHHSYPSKNVAEHFLSHCYNVWQSWPREHQRRITTLLAMHSRVPGYEWDWERFTIEYMVFDGLWKLARIRGVVPDCPHRERINLSCQTFSMALDKNLAYRISSLRNDLFHETLWDKSLPCTAVSEGAFLQVNNLRHLNQRIIPALLGYQNSYVRSPWWSLSSFVFDKPKDTRED